MIFYLIFIFSFRHINEENKEKDALKPSVNNELNKIPSEKSFKQLSKEDPKDLLIKSFKLTHGMYIYIYNIFIIRNFYEELIYIGIISCTRL